MDVSDFISAINGCLDNICWAEIKFEPFIVKMDGSDGDNTYVVQETTGSRSSVNPILKLREIIWFLICVKPNSAVTNHIALNKDIKELRDLFGWLQVATRTMVHI